MNKYNDMLIDPTTKGLLERFLRYVKVETTSDRHIEDIPSTPSQWELARLLSEELKTLGLSDIHLDDHCYLCARLPATKGFESKPCIGFMAHMDTASDVTAHNVKPRVVEKYDGKPIALSDSCTLDPTDYPDLADHAGDTLVVTDGSTLLGADDKAGVAEILTALQHLREHPKIAHGPLEVFFTPDEETGKGMNLFPVKQVRSVACYTLDGGKAGEIEAECFTAYSVKLSFTGYVIHIGSARGKLANAVAMAAAFATMLPRSESPEATDEWYGYYCPIEIQGTLEAASMEVFLRDFTEEGMARRIETIKVLAKAVEAQFPGGKVDAEVTKQYVNMRRKLDTRPEVLARLIKACEDSGVAPTIKPIRGGTDGARLTELGIPTPNIFTGGYNYHSRYEWASLSEMAKTVQVVLRLAQLWA
jgi:tripeptide aminopeptidase